MLEKFKTNNIKLVIPLKKDAELVVQHPFVFSLKSRLAPTFLCYFVFVVTDLAADHAE